jgi:hypothetical protein
MDGDFRTQPETNEAHNLQNDIHSPAMRLRLPARVR